MLEQINYGHFLVPKYVQIHFNKHSNLLVICLTVFLSLYEACYFLSFKSYFFFLPSFDRRSGNRQETGEKSGGRHAAKDREQESNPDCCIRDQPVQTGYPLNPLSYPGVLWGLFWSQTSLPVNSDWRVFRWIQILPKLISVCATLVKR